MLLVISPCTFISNGLIGDTGAVEFIDIYIFDLPIFVVLLCPLSW